MREPRLRFALALFTLISHLFGMVAEISATPQKPAPNHASRFPEATRLTIRSLYVVQGRAPAEIALALSLKPQQVRNLVTREGWTQLKSKRADSRKQKGEQALLARADADVQRVVEATAILSEDLSLRSLNLSSEFLDAKDAKSLQMASGAAMNFVKIARMSRGLDSRGGNTPNGVVDSPTLNLFVVRGETLERAVKQADAVIEVSAKTLPASQ